jgi:hypothetical protein
LSLGSANKGSARRQATESARRCGLGWPRCGKSTSAARRDGRSWGNSGARHTAARRLALRQGYKRWERRKRRGRPRFSQRGGGVDVADLTETVARRGRSRWRLAPCSASASQPRRGCPPPSWRLVRLPSTTDDHQQRRVGGDAVHGSFFPASTLTPPPLSSSPAAALTRKGENPKRALACVRGSTLGYWRPVKAAQGQGSADRAPIGGFSRGGDVVGRQWWPPPL